MQRILQQRIRARGTLSCDELPLREATTYSSRGLHNSAPNKRSESTVILLTLLLFSMVKAGIWLSLYLGEEGQAHHAIALVQIIATSGSRDERNEAESDRL